MAGHPDHYSREQMVAHWMIVLFVLMQYMMGDDVARWFGGLLEGEATPSGLGPIYVHGFMGALIFIVMAFRLYERLTRGVPPAPTTEPRPIQFASRAVHWAFYVVLLALPVFGALAVFLQSGFVGWLHMLTTKLLLLLIVAHIGGAVWHLFRKSDKTTARMWRQDPPGRI
ncbi:cytochrome b/b6 domain-containing protein [Roseicyclus sp. F158]|uniref:Cytochrome b/b6 domain-containing protein n=1 Tax=Tropicimonas omnivorans TaxID=3075590 RepID=A0ABU3DKL3_9RHOB|nr:cytochrome b/b6 domain-containing protein [Roseicyclus sp. F158]MDT0684259.1 cytochrome b/b6 domain-containing protein [Roseicyclus sp. F158]